MAKQPKKSIEQPKQKINLDDYLLKSIVIRDKAEDCYHYGKFICYDNKGADAKVELEFEDYIQSNYFRDRDEYLEKCANEGRRKIRIEIALENMAEIMEIRDIPKVEKAIYR